MTYPALEQIEQSIEMETAAVVMAIGEMAKVIEATPLSDGLKVYAILGLVIKYGSLDYIDQVFNELIYVVSVDSDEPAVTH